MRNYHYFELETLAGILFILFLGIVIGTYLGHYFLPNISIIMPPNANYTFDIGENALKIMNITK